MHSTVRMSNSRPVSTRTMSSLWVRASQKGLHLFRAAEWHCHVRSKHRQHRQGCQCQAAAQQAVKSTSRSSQQQQQQLTLDLDTASVAEQASMDEIAQIMAAKLEQQARLMPPDIDQSLDLDPDSSLDWQNTDLSRDEDAEASADAPAAPQQVKPGSRRALKRGDKPRTKEIPFQDLPKVAIVGRPNVGKSALFNRITGSATAIVYDYPGVTRDRLYTRAYWGNTEFVVVDTGGLMGDASKLDAEISAAAMHAISAEGLPEAIERQAAAGVAEADCIVLVMDGQTGLTATDEEIVSWLRRSHPKKPVMLAINKCENPQKADIQVAVCHAASFRRLLPFRHMLNPY